MTYIYKSNENVHIEQWIKCDSESHRKQGMTFQCYPFPQTPLLPPKSMDIEPSKLMVMSSLENDYLLIQILK